MKNEKLRRLVLTALFAAMTTVATMIIQIPVPATGGYVHPGDSVILMCAWLLGPIPGAVAGALGSGLADALSGYALYVPATAVIKALMGLCAGGLFARVKNRAAGRMIGGAAAGVVMVLGYFVYEALLLGFGLAAAASIPANLFQALFGLAAAAALLRPMDRLSLRK